MYYCSCPYVFTTLKSSSCHTFCFLQCRLMHCMLRFKDPLIVILNFDNLAWLAVIVPQSLWDGDYGQLSLQQYWSKISFFNFMFIFSSSLSKPVLSIWSFFVSSNLHFNPIGVGICKFNTQLHLGIRSLSFHNLMCAWLLYSSSLLVFPSSLFLKQFIKPGLSEEAFHVFSIIGAT